MIIRDNVLFGLSPEEVDDQKKLGNINVSTNKKTKTYSEIFLKNIFSIFNLVIFVMGIFVLPTIEGFGDFGNILFLLIATLNLLIGIVQEIKAKKTVDNLVLVNESKIKVLRNLEIEEISIEEIVLGDILILESGKQIPTDSVVIRGEISVNESNITGESDDIVKKEGDSLYSGSYVVSGECYCKTIHVGKDNYIEVLTAKASKYKKPNSEIMNSLNKIITSISLFLLPLSIILYFVYRGYDAYISTNYLFLNVPKELVLGLVSAINGMIPYGLFLLTSVSLAASVMKLAKNKTLVQDLYCIEQLARVDTLCLDKTGTITDGTMTVNDLKIINNNYQVIEIISSMNASLKGNNQTSEALINKWGKDIYFKPLNILNFNSTNKFSAVTFKNIGTFVLGAPDILIKNKKASIVSKMIEENAKKGLRVLALCSTKSNIVNDTLNGPFECIALITIKDNIRVGAKDTIKMFIDNNVNIKIISGDNPITVSSIAKDAGVPNYDKYISLDGLTDDEVMDVATKYTVFGRVKPAQKKIIVETLKSNGRKVAMTGDGVNDILALREADCSIVMASGSDCVKSIAHVVLLDSSFSSLPKIVEEGRRVINNIERTASLYLSKTVLMFLINISAIVMFFIRPGMQFASPFREPSQLVIIEVFIIGLPTLFLALEANNQIIKGKFIRNILSLALPGGIIAFIVVFGIRIISPYIGMNHDVETNVSIFSSIIVFLLILASISFPFSKERFIVTIVTSIIVAVLPIVSLITMTTYGFDLFHFRLDYSTNMLAFDRNGLYTLLIALSFEIISFSIIFIYKYFRYKGVKKHETRKL